VTLFDLNRNNLKIFSYFCDFDYKFCPELGAIGFFSVPEYVFWLLKSPFKKYSSVFWCEAVNFCAHKKTTLRWFNWMGLFPISYR